MEIDMGFIELLVVALTALTGGAAGGAGAVHQALNGMRKEVHETRRDVVVIRERLAILETTTNMNEISRQRDRDHGH